MALPSLQNMELLETAGRMIIVNKPEEEYFEKFSSANESLSMNALKRSIYLQPPSAKIGSPSKCFKNSDTTTLSVGREEVVIIDENKDDENDDATKKKAKHKKNCLSQISTNPNFQGKGGLTALIIAVSKRNKGVIKELLALENIDVNLGDKDEYTPLICASEKGYTDIVKLLLLHKDIIVNTEDKNGYTAIM
jgi:ankyrin repeat protein